MDTHNLLSKLASLFLHDCLLSLFFQFAQRFGRLISLTQTQNAIFALHEASFAHQMDSDILFECFKVRNILDLPLLFQL